MCTPVYGEKYVKLASEHGVLGVARVSLYGKIDDKEDVVVSAVVLNSGTGDPKAIHRMRHGHAFRCSVDHEMVVTYATDIFH